MKKYLLIIPFLLAFRSVPEQYPYQKVYIEWVDIIATDSGWHTKEDVDYWILNEESTVKQTGFLYKETTTYVVVIDSFISKTYLGAATKIPKGNIVKFTKF